MLCAPIFFCAVTYFFSPLEDAQLATISSIPAKMRRAYESSPYLAPEMRWRPMSADRVYREVTPRANSVLQADPWQHRTRGFVPSPAISPSSSSTKPAPPKLANARRRPASARERRVRGDFSQDYGIWLDANRRLADGHTDLSQVSAAMLSASANSALLSSAACRDLERTTGPNHAARGKGQGNQGDIRKQEPVTLPTQSFAEFSTPASSNVNVSIKASENMDIASRRRPWSADRILVTKASVDDKHRATRGNSRRPWSADRIVGTESSMNGNASCDTRRASRPLSGRSRPQSSKSDLIKICEEHWSSDDDETDYITDDSHILPPREGASAPTPGRTASTPANIGSHQVELPEHRFLPAEQLQKKWSATSPPPRASSCSDAGIVDGDVEALHAPADELGQGVCGKIVEAGQGHGHGAGEGEGDQVLWQQLKDCQALVGSLQMQMSEQLANPQSIRQDFAIPGRVMLHTLSEALNNRRQQLAELVHEHHVCKAQLTEKLNDADNRLKEATRALAAALARAHQGEIDASHQRQLLQGLQQSSEREVAALQEQIELLKGQGADCVERVDVECVEGVLSRGRDSTIIDKLSSGDSTIIDRLSSGEGEMNSRKRLQMNKARAQSFMLVARTKQLQSKLESTSANLALREAEVARLTGLVNELREQQSSVATKMTGGKASMQARRTHLLQLISSSHLVGGEMCHETQKILETGEEKEKVREMGASRVITDPTTGLSCEANAYAVLLAIADDDHLMSKLIESEARVEELMKECTTLRTQQVVDTIYTCALENDKKKEVSPAQLKEQVANFTEKLNDAQLEVVRLGAQLRESKSETEELKSLLQSSHAEVEKLKKNTKKPDKEYEETRSTETELRSQIDDLQTLRKQAEVRLQRLEKQLSESKREQTALHKALVDERKIHTNWQLVKELQLQVAELQDKVKLAHSDPLQLIYEYNEVSGMHARKSACSKDRSLSSKAADVERERSKLFSNLRKTLEMFESQIQILVKEAYRYKCQVTKWKNAKMAVDVELASARGNQHTVDQTVRELEAHAEARADRIRPFLRITRLELVRTLIDYANAIARRLPDSAFEMWKRAMKILEGVGAPIVDGALNDIETKEQELLQQLGPMDCATVLHKMGVVQLEKKFLHEAKGLFSKALAIRETEGGYDHIQAKKTRVWLRKCVREIEVTQSKGMRPSRTASVSEEEEDRDYAHDCSDSDDEHVLPSVISPAHSFGSADSSLKSPVSSPNPDGSSRFRRTKPRASDVDKDRVYSSFELGDELGLTIAVESDKHRLFASDKHRLFEDKIQSGEEVAQMLAQSLVGKLQKPQPLPVPKISETEDGFLRTGSQSHRCSDKEKPAPARGSKYHGQFDSFVQVGGPE